MITKIRLPVTEEEAIAVDWTAPNEPSAPTVVFVPGFGSHRRGDKATYLGKRLMERGWGYASLDLRGHGDSDGTLRELTLSRSLADLKTLFDWLPIGDAPLLLIGSSMGAAVTGWYLLRSGRVPRGVVWIAPSWGFPGAAVAALSPEEREHWARTGVRRFQSDWLDVEISHGLMEDAAHYTPDELLLGHHPPTLIFHGTQDEAVPWQQSLDFVERCPAERIDLLLIKQAGHRLTAYKQYLTDTLLAWWETLPPAPTV